MQQEQYLENEKATEALGARLYQEWAPRPGGVLYLHGDLGAGKTTLARGFMRAAGVGGTLRSPTHTLMEPYEAGGRSFLHLDLYRVADPGEVEYLGLLDYPPDSTLWLVEWPEKGRGHLPQPDLVIELVADGDGRRAALTQTRCVE